MERVLQVFPQINNAGTEKVIMNLYNNINRDKIQFDFLVKKEGLLDYKIKELGGKIYYINKENKKQYYKNLIAFFNKNKYKVVHVHTHGDMGLVLKVAKKCKVDCRIIHSHNSRQDLPKIVKLLKLYRNIKVENNATDFFACSEDAAKWLFPHKYKKTKIVYNAIDIEKFTYDEQIRENTRRKLNIGDNEKLVINVARFAKEKNHIRILKIAKKIQNKHKDIKFILVGNGDLEETIKSKVKEYGLQNIFLFLGNRNDVNELLMASDIFLFPTLHEGLGIAVVEAQFSGLQCITSDRVPKEADIGANLLQRISLNKNDDYWCNLIEEEITKKIVRKNVWKDCDWKRYDIKNITDDIEKFYLTKIGEKFEK